MEDGIHDFQPSVGKCLHQCFFGDHLVGDIAESDHAASDLTGLIAERARVHAEVNAIWPILIADEHVLIFGGFTAENSAVERAILGFYGRFAVEMKKAVLFRPFCWGVYLCRQFV